MLRVGLVAWQLAKIGHSLVFHCRPNTSRLARVSGGEGRGGVFVCARVRVFVVDYLCMSFCVGADVHSHPITLSLSSLFFFLSLHLYFLPPSFSFAPEDYNMTHPGYDHIVFSDYRK